MVDVVYVVRRGDRNEELRYSLRSLVNLPHDRVWIAGYKPRWVANVGHIDVQQTGSKWSNSTRNLLAACRHDQVSGQFVLMNDDMFITEPIDRMPVFHRGPVREVIRSYERAGSRDYVTGMRQTLGLLEELGYEDPLSYELHVPLPVDKRRMAESIEFPGRIGRRLAVLHKRTLYGNLHWIQGEYMDDVKVSATHKRWSPDWGFISTDDASFVSPDGPGGWIRALFPEPCGYEC